MLKDIEALRAQHRAYVDLNLEIAAEAGKRLVPYAVSVLVRAMILAVLGRDK